MCVPLGFTYCTFAALWSEMPACEGDVTLVVHLVGILVVEGWVSLLAPGDAGRGLGCLLSAALAWLRVDDRVGVYLP